MAIADIFGPTPEELEYQRGQEQENRSRQEYLAKLPNYGSEFGRYAGVARAGLETGEKLRGLRLFGESPSPEMERATVMKQILKTYQGQDMSNPDVLAKMSQELGQQGYPREAMQLMDQAKATVATRMKAEQAAEQAKFDRSKDVLSMEETQADIDKKRREAEGGQGDYLTDKAMETFKEDATNINTFKALNATSDFSYFQLTRPQLEAAKMTPGTVAAVTGKTVEQVRDSVVWWTQYDAFLAMVRNKLYGSALTKTEIENFERSIVTATTDEETAQRMLSEQLQIAMKGYKANAEFSKEQGRNIRGVYELIGEVRPMSGVTTSPEEFEIISIE
jgi:hypothetical protein